MKVRYSEGLAEVSVEGVSEPVRRGETVEVDDKVGEQLIKQGWEEAGSVAGSVGEQPVKQGWEETSQTKKEGI